jgi:hypothetical protein
MHQKCFRTFLSLLVAVVVFDLLFTFTLGLPSLPIIHLPPATALDNESNRTESIFIASLHYNDEALGGCVALTELDVCRLTM